MDELLLDLTGKYSFELSYDEENDTVYASTKAATSLLHEDVDKLKDLVGAQTVEIYADEHADYTFLLQFTR